MRIFLCLFYDNFQGALQSSSFQGWFRRMQLIKFDKSWLCLFKLETYRHIFIAEGIRSFFGQIQMLIRLVYHTRLLCSFGELLCNNREKYSAALICNEQGKIQRFSSPTYPKSLERPLNGLTHRWEISAWICEGQPIFSVVNEYAERSHEAFQALHLIRSICYIGMYISQA